MIFGAAWAFFQPAYTGLLPQTVPEDELQAARALTEGAWNLSMVLGPSLATVLVLTIGAGEAFAIDAATFLVSAITLLPIRPRARGRGAAAARQESVLHGLRAGFREVSSRPWVWVTISAFSVVLMCSYATWEALGPLVVRDAYGEVGLFGVFVALYGVGSVVGSAIGSVWRSRRPLRDGLLLAGVWPGMSVVVALALPRALVGIWMCLAGVQSGLFMVIWETSLARHIPPAALSRVSSYDWMGSLALLPLGFALSGPLASLFGARTVLGVGGAIGVFAVLAHARPALHPTPHGRTGGRFSGVARQPKGNSSTQLSRVSSAEQLAGQVRVEARRVAQVAHVDALVGVVHQRLGLGQHLVAMREEAVGDQVREGGAEVARVRVARQQHRDRSRARVDALDPALDRVHQLAARG